MFFQTFEESLRNFYHTKAVKLQIKHHRTCALYFMSSKVIQISVVIHLRMFKNVAFFPNTWSEWTNELGNDSIKRVGDDMRVSKQWIFFIFLLWTTL